MPAIRIRLRAGHFGAINVVRLLSALGETFFMLVRIIPYLWAVDNTKTHENLLCESGRGFQRQRDSPMMALNNTSQRRRRPC